jgi:hypothetical protein
MNRFVIFVVLLGLTIVIVGGAALALVNRPVTQPIAFNHLLHIEEVGAECVDCHLYAQSGVRATIPNIDICADCHEEPQTESAEEARVVEFIQDGTPIPWRRVYWVPSHVYFSHRRHTEIAGIDCATCHGPVEEREEALSRALVSMTMGDCIDCHDAAGASNDCILCHQ